MAFRLIKIDDALRREHHYLSDDDECYCLGEYFPREGYKAGAVNSMISNFKKPVTKRHLAEYRHKENDIVRAGTLVRSALGKDAPSTCTFVPIPPSKARNDPLYDDRLARVLRSGTPALDVRELFVMTASTRAHHEFSEGEKRPTPDDLYQILAIDESCVTQPLKPTVILFDDLLTAGTHFKACQRKLLEWSPQSRVLGLFIGRRKVPANEGVDFDSIFGPDA